MNRTTPPTSVTVPPVAGWVTAVTVSVSPVSGAVASLASTLTTVAPLSSATVAASLPAVGGSLTGVTVTVTVAVELWLVASVIVYWKVSVPVKLALGVYWIVPPALTVAVPLAGAAAIVVTIGGSPRPVSLARTLSAVELSSATVNASGLATGTSASRVVEVVLLVAVRGVVPAR